MSKPFKMKAAGHNNSPMQKNFPGDVKANPGDSPANFNFKKALGGGLTGAFKGLMTGGPMGMFAGAVGGGALAGLGKKTHAQEFGADTIEDINETPDEKLKRKIDEKTDEKAEEIVNQTE